MPLAHMNLFTFWITSELASRLCCMQASHDQFEVSRSDGMHIGRLILDTAQEVRGWNLTEAQADYVSSL